MKHFCLTAWLAVLLGMVGQPAHAALVLNNLTIGSLGTYDVAFVGSSAGVAANGPNAPFTTQVNATTAVDAIITAEETRDTLAFLLRATSNFAGPHIGPFVLPAI